MSATSTRIVFCTADDYISQRFWACQPYIGFTAHVSSSAVDQPAHLVVSEVYQAALFAEDIFL